MLEGSPAVGCTPNISPGSPQQPAASAHCKQGQREARRHRASLPGSGHSPIAASHSAHTCHRAHGASVNPQAHNNGSKESLSALKEHLLLTGIGAKALLNGAT